MITDYADPWSHFLHARKLLIDELLKDPEYNYGRIARLLSMDALQVQLIAMTEVDPKLYGNTRDRP